MKHAILHGMKLSDTATQTELFYKTFQGEPVPTLGFGTFKLKGDMCRKAVEAAIEVGYRHIDTARAYGNEKEVGRALAGSRVDREKLFLTSKVWRDDLEPQRLKEEVATSLDELGTDFLNLVLIHWPNPEFDLRESIEALEDLRSEGRIRHYGVSNFTPRLLEVALSYGKVFCNQVEYHPLLAQDKLLAITRRHEIMLTAYSPLAQGEVFEIDELEPIARKHGMNTAQVALRWLIEQDGVVAIPRSSSPDHIKSNFAVFDFKLDEADHEAISRLPKDRRQINPSFAPDWGDSGSS